MKLSATKLGGWRVGWRVVGILGWLVPVTLGACIIEERKYSLQLDDCSDYCDRLETNCAGSNRVYEHRDACMATCMLMDYGGDIGDSTADTLTCRLDRLRAGIESPQCSLVGPGGGGACGSNCKALCALRAKVCRGFPSESDPTDITDLDKCENDCAALTDRQDMDASGIDLSGDTVQCRLLHISQAAISPEEAAKHCSHTQIRPPPGENPGTAPCSDEASTDLNAECQKYCRIVTTACTGPNAVYQTEDQCLNTCRTTMVPGQPGDQTLDTVRCRRYHAYFSLLEPESHCLHASATGDGHCGAENCTAYCRILQDACSDDFERTFGATTGTTDGGFAACTAACLPDTPDGPSKIVGWKRDEFALPPSGVRYQVDPPPTGNSLMCRSYHAVQALNSSLNDRPLHCAAALGGGDCR